METVSNSARTEILAAVRVRYGRASRLEKGRIFGEFGAVACYQRKSAIRLLNPRTVERGKTVVERAPVYGAADFDPKKRGGFDADRLHRPSSDVPRITHGPTPSDEKTVSPLTGQPNRAARPAGGL